MPCLRMLDVICTSLFSCAVGFGRKEGRKEGRNEDGNGRMTALPRISTPHPSPKLSHKWEGIKSFESILVCKALIINVARCRLFPYLNTFQHPSAANFTSRRVSKNFLQMLAHMVGSVRIFNVVPWG